MVNFERYVPPSVIVESEPVAPAVNVGVSPVVMGIVGPSVGYRTQTEAVVLTGVANSRLASLGIDPTSVVVSGADGTPFTVTTDYVLTAGGGADADILTTRDNVLDIKRVADGAIGDGAEVYVTYRYTDEKYMTPTVIQDADEAYRMFGAPYDAQTGAITSPLSLACQIAMRNGASSVVLQSTTGLATVTTDAELVAAYAKLTTVFDLDIIVPLTVGLSGTNSDPGDALDAGQSLAAYLADLDLDETIKRVGILGWEKDGTVSPDTIAAGVGERRVQIAYPNRMNLYMPALRQSIEVGGYYLAAAYAGILAKQPIQMPNTNKQIYGFSGIPASMLATMTRQLKNQWSAGGVAVTEQTRDGRLVIRHGVTTNTGTIYDRELSLVRADDAIFQLMQDTFNASGLIGTWISADTPAQVKMTAVSALDRAVSAGIMVAYANCKARQVSVDPSIIEVKFQYLPSYPLNYIVVRYSVNTDTGQITRILGEAA